MNYSVHQREGVLTRHSGCRLLFLYMIYMVFWLSAKTALVLHYDRYIDYRHCTCTRSSYTNKANVLKSPSSSPAGFHSRQDESGFEEPDRPSDPAVVKALSLARLQKKNHWCWNEGKTAKDKNVDIEKNKTRIRRRRVAWEVAGANWNHLAESTECHFATAAAFSFSLPLLPCSPPNGTSRALDRLTNRSTQAWMQARGLTRPISQAQRLLVMRRGVLPFSDECH